MCRYVAFAQHGSSRLRNTRSTLDNAFGPRNSRFSNIASNSSPRRLIEKKVVDLASMTNRVPRQWNWDKLFSHLASWQRSKNISRRFIKLELLWFISQVARLSIESLDFSYFIASSWWLHFRRRNENGNRKWRIEKSWWTGVVWLESQYLDVCST